MKKPMEWWKKISANDVGSGANIQNIPTTHTTQCQKSKQPNQKMGRSPTGT